MQHATTDPDRTRRVLEEIERGIKWRMRLARMKRWARPGSLVEILAGSALVLVILYATLIALTYRALRSVLS